MIIEVNINLWIVVIVVMVVMLIRVWVVVCYDCCGEFIVFVKFVFVFVIIKIFSFMDYFFL